jgi:Uma2 family endonuclease
MRTEPAHEAMPIIKSGATYDDLIAVSDERVTEIVDGALHVSPRPSARHALATAELYGALGNAFHRATGGPGGWWILFELELHLGVDVVVPDLAGWRRERLPEVPDAPWLSLAPDWICEVASPSTEQLDRVGKLRIYARAGIGHAWIVNPIMRTLEIYRRAADSWTLVATHGGDETVRAEPFEAVELNLRSLWSGTPSP